MVEAQGLGELTEGLGAPIRKLLEQRDGAATVVRLASGDDLMVYNVAWGRDLGDVWEHVTANCSPPNDDHPIHFFHLSEVVSLSDAATGRVLMQQVPAPGKT